MTNEKLTPPWINAPLFLTRLVRGHEASTQNLLSVMIRWGARTDLWSGAWRQADPWVSLTLESRPAEKSKPMRNKVGDTE